MSFLNSVLGSIGSGTQAPLLKTPDPSSKATAATVVSSAAPKPRKDDNLAQQASRNVPSRPLKRKSDGQQSQSAPVKPNTQGNRTTSQSTLSSAQNVKSKSARTPVATSRQNLESPAQASKPPHAQAQTKSAPPRSFQALMAEAAALQKQKASAANQVGIIKHAASNKERISKAERRRREAELQAQRKDKVSRIGSSGAIQKPGQGLNGKSKGSGTGSSLRKGVPESTAASAGSKSQLDPSQTKGEPVYKGTAGLGRRNPNKNAPRPPRGTLREDDYDDDDSMDSFVVDDDDDEEQKTRASWNRDRGSKRYTYASDDGSSDMEAGYTDVELEEQTAAMQAKRDDEREKRIEERLKREKEERRKSYLEKRR